MNPARPTAPPTPPASTRATAMLGALFFTFTVGLTSVGMVVMLERDVFSGRRIVRRVQAQEIAIGAASQALAILAEDKTQIENPSADLKAGGLGPGTYDVEIRPLGDDNFIIESSGTIGDECLSVKVYFKDNRKPAAFRYGIFANGNLTMTGGGCANVNLDAGSHSNLDTDISGNADVSGSVSAGGTVRVRGAASVGGATLQHVPRIEFPELDYDYYYGIAAANNEIYYASGNGTYSLSGIRAPRGGVMWVVGNVKVTSHTYLFGALIATGDIDQAGQCNIYQSPGELALISRDGDIHLSGHSDYMCGLIYSGHGNIDLTGYHRIVGQLMAWGDIFTRGNWGVVDYEEWQNPDPHGDSLDVRAWEF